MGVKARAYHRGMPAAVDAPVRLRRAAGFALTSTALAAGAHVLGAGALPNGWLLAVGAAAVTAAAVPLVARERSLVQIGLALAAAQAALHGWFVLTGHHHGHAAASSPALMLAWHGVATVAAALWLRRYERRAWLAARRLWVLLVLAAWPQVRTPGPQRRPAPARPSVLRPLRPPLLATASGLRAPPC
jgi:hypothetical protein